ncbi:MAG: hypothetical protein KC635_09155, partial [Myxococcales bacterium]|nr:hypothetical protein [Myxococcales bacterium]
ACGDLPEQDELNNERTETLALCPNPTPVISGVDIRADGPIQYDVPVTITASIRNAGTNAITVPVALQLSSDLGAVLETDKDGADDTVTVTNSCADPIDPGQKKDVTFVWTPRKAEDVRQLIAIVDPAGVVEECNEADNQATRALRLDLSPWKDRAGMNYGTLVDIEVDAAPVFGEALSGRYLIHNYGDTTASEPPLVIVPNGGADAKNTLSVARGDDSRTLDSESQILAPAPGAPQTVPFTFTPSALLCTPENPMRGLEVVVDSLDYFDEAVETNNVTLRPFANLVVSDIVFGSVAQSRVDMDLVTADASDPKAMPFGAHRVGGSVTAPDGTVTTFTALGPYTTVGQHDLADGFVLRQNGTYSVTAIVDVPDEARLCGDLPEANELDNDRTETLTLCPNVVPTLALGDIRVGEPSTVTVTITNTGNTTLIEDVQVTLSGTRASDGGAATLAVDQNPKTLPLAFGAGLDPGASAAVTFAWTPSASEQVSLLTATLAVLDTDPDNGPFANAECSYADNVDSEPLAIDLTPWRDALARGENYIVSVSPDFVQYVDIAVASAPVNGAALDTSTQISNHGTFTPGDVDVVLRELRGDADTVGADIASVSGTFRPPAGGALDAVIPWTPSTVRGDTNPLGPLWGVSIAVDRPGEITETIETNNTTRRLLVDLVPSQLLIAGGCKGGVPRGLDRTVTVRVSKPLPPTGRDIPEMPLTPYYVSLYVDGALDRTVGPFAGTGRLTLATDVRFDDLAQHTLEARIDEAGAGAPEDNRVPERDEDNNRIAIAVTSVEPLADLVYATTSPTLTITSGESGDPVTVAATVGNTGEIPAPAFAVTLWIDGVQRDSVLVNGLAVGATQAVSLTWPAATLG